MIRAVLFDVGECLVDESREWDGWAAWLGVPRHTFSTQFGVTIAQGREHWDTFKIFKPGFDLARERAKRDAVDQPEWFGENDLYPDVRITIRLLRQAGLLVGVAANQSEATTIILRRLFESTVDLIATSYDTGGIEKPDPRFFQIMAQALRLEPHEVLYVGDRLDEDIRPAGAAGLQTALINRGPWGLTHRFDPDADTLPTMRIDGLRELNEGIAKYNAGAH
ncbi:HAD family hydrolase [Streptomyces sp. RFCAC02]|uniref:HAD family hydrolase n=1 Tax=Streptomyces sp. RFCAC02 TaxID=2499143 RepID=UPI0010217515|nr:HAD family hydrolase [Streptomyces sp. RFCAC02]